MPLATVVGVLVEVPVMLSLVAIASKVNRRFFSDWIERSSVHARSAAGVRSVLQHGADLVWWPLRTSVISMRVGAAGAFVITAEDMRISLALSVVTWTFEFGR